MPKKAMGLRNADDRSARSMDHHPLTIVTSTFTASGGPVWAACQHVVLFPVAASVRHGLASDSLWYGVVLTKFVDHGNLGDRERAESAMRVRNTNASALLKCVQSSKDEQAHEPGQKY
jgi:hypothetical protein